MTNLQSFEISHVGIAVSNLQESIARYKLLLGNDPSLVAEVKDQSVKIAIFAPKQGNEHAEGGRIELLEPTSPESPIQRFLDSRGEGLHHLCVYVDDIEATMRELREAGVTLIDNEPRIGAEGNRIAFVHPRDMHGVLIELEERSD